MSPSHETPQTPPAQVLIVEDEPDHADVMAAALRRPGHVCTIVQSVPEAIAELREGSFDIIITDLRMPNSAGVQTPAGTVAADGGDAGLHVLKAAATYQPQAETIMVTAHGDVPTARAAFKDGAFDFIEKPLDLAVFRSVVNRAAEQVVLRHEEPEIGNDLIPHDGFAGIIADSHAMRQILNTVKTVAPSNIPVLITGESGTGKELIANAIHKHSLRADQRFVAFNCAGQAESLLEDELFGHVRGAFTGAEQDRQGVFEYADGGTLFLDEIGDMPLAMQAKLLRVLESGELVPLGSNEPRRVDVRFISATNKDLASEAKDKRFREDLFFRLNGAHIHLPPLRERREDIPRIVRHAIARFASELAPQRPVPGISDAALMRLSSYDWPGNVRQLLNVVQNMVVTAIGQADPNPASPVTLDVVHIPEEISHHQPGEINPEEPAHTSGSLAGTSLEALEKRAIRDTLKLTAGNREQTAKLLGIGERTLYRKLKEYGLR